MYSRKYVGALAATIFFPIIFYCNKFSAIKICYRLYLLNENTYNIHIFACGPNTKCVLKKYMKQ